MSRRALRCSRDWSAIQRASQILLLSADDIGQLEPMRVHGWFGMRWRSSESSVAGLDVLTLASGRGETWVAGLVLRRGHAAK
jgi:hypothetical protein